MNLRQNAPLLLSIGQGPVSRFSFLKTLFDTVLITMNSKDSTHRQ